MVATEDEGANWVVRGGTELYESERAWIVREWLSGKKTADISKAIGRPAASIPKAISDFCASMGYPTKGLTAPARVEAASAAIATFEKAGGVSTHPEHMRKLVAAVVLQRRARSEYIVHLKDAVGLSYAEIGDRLGLSEHYVQEKAAFERLRIKREQADVAASSPQL